MELIITEIIKWYLSVGCAFYIIRCVKEFPSLKDNDWKSVVYGFLLSFLWPILIWMAEWRLPNKK